MELLVVLLIIALVSAAVLQPVWRPSDAAQLRSAALVLASDLRRARSWAITHDATARVRFDLNHRSYNARAGTKARALPASATVTVSLGGDPTSRESGSADLTFWPDGTAAGGEITLAAHRARQRVSVDWLTGHVSTTE